MVKEDYCATNVASSETLSPSGFVSASCCGPEESAGVVNVRVLLSLKMTVNSLPPSEAFVPTENRFHGS
jgi:hypothetical protein